MTTARECAWAAEAEGAWLSIKSGAAGQGDGVVEYEARPNPDPQVRRGALILNDQRAELTQAAGECVLALAETSAQFSAAGGSGRVQVNASSPLCTWTTRSEAEWIGLRSPADRSGSGAVEFEVEPAAGPSRDGTLVIAGQTFTVTQSAAAVPPPGPTPPPNPPPGPTPPPNPPPPPPACTFAVSPAAHAIGAAGGTGHVAVTAPAGCAWTASTATSWIAIQGPSAGTGTGSVTFTAAATTGPARTGTLIVAGQTITVTQSQGCSYAISPENENVPASGGTRAVRVSAAAGCAWTASSNTEWIAIAAGQAGSGNGTVEVSVAATTGPSRSGTATIAGRTYTVNQGQGCTFTLSASSVDVPASGARPEFTVDTAAGCAWTVAESSSWLSISSELSNVGPGTVRFVANANLGPARTAIVTAAGLAFTVNQAAGCTYRLSAAGQDVDAAGGTGTIGVTAASGCTWTAVSGAPWLTITAGETGSGNGSVAFTAQPNPAAPRTADLTVAGQTFTVRQAQACTFAIAPEQQAVPAAGGRPTVNVTAPAGCNWTAASNAPWITVGSGAAGSGNGLVETVVAANPGAARTGTATIAGRTFTVDQAAGCTFAVAPSALTAPAGGGAAKVEVTTDATCGWTAASGVEWVTIVGSAAGQGPGGVELSVAANAGPARTGAVTIAGHAVNVTQESGCTFALSATSHAAPAAGGPGAVSVTAGAGCSWTAATEAPWITIDAGAAGAGDGAVQFTVQANATGLARTATITIAGLTFTVSQE